MGAADIGLHCLIYGDEKNLNALIAKHRIENDPMTGALLDVGQRYSATVNGAKSRAPVAFLEFKYWSPEGSYGETRLKALCQDAADNFDLYWEWFQHNFDTDEIKYDYDARDVEIPEDHPLAGNPYFLESEVKSWVDGITKLEE